MKTKIEIKSIWGSVLFSYKKEDNTIKDTLEEAVRSDANLGGAYLGDANLGDEWGELQSSSDVLTVGPIGSRNDYTTIYHTDKGIFVRCGCFRGSLNEFSEKVKETHGESKHAKDYLALIDFVKAKYNASIEVSYEETRVFGNPIKTSVYIDDYNILEVEGGLCVDDLNIKSIINNIYRHVKY